MLPTQLKAVKDRLEAKGEAKRTTGEHELLVELIHLHTSLSEEHLHGLTVEEVEGPLGHCPCCGRPF
jgi:hypothetical protein